MSAPACLRLPRTPRPTPSTWLPVLLVWLLAGPSWAQHPPTEPQQAPAAPAVQPLAAAPAMALGLSTARTLLHQQSHTLAASRAAVQTQQLRGQALRRLGGPSVALTGMAYAYNANLHLDLDPLNQSLDQLQNQLPGWAQELTGRVPLPQLPGSHTLNRHGSGTHAAVSAVWPIYAGGLADAARGLVAAQQREAEADVDLAAQHIDTLLVQRYFGTQLARRAAELRQQAEHTIAAHDAAAQRLLDEGLIARVERLQASAALEEARRQRVQAEHDAALAASALAALLQQDTPLHPSTPLFVISAPLEPLAHFIDAALTHHPGLNKVAAKKTQAERLHEGQQAGRRPQVVAFGTRQLRSGNADWAAGLGVRWTLYDAIDRQALAASSLQQISQAEHSDAQLRSDLALLVERHWRATESARQQYLDMAQAEALADELLRLRQAGLREGSSTALELIEAETRHTQVLTERAQAAHNYVQALAQLLESAGLTDQFDTYLARADIRL